MSNAKSSPCTPKSFFDLPYDIPEQIYRQIETDALPPLSGGAPYAGFVLSCKLAAEELSYVATQNYRNYLDEFKRRSKQRVGDMITILEPEQVPAGQSSPIAHLHQVKVEVNLDNALDSHFHFKDSESWCDMFHPLFRLIVDDVKIHFNAPTDLEMSLETFAMTHIHFYSMALRLFDLIENSGLQTDISRKRFSPPKHTAKLTRFLEDFESQVNGF